MFEFQIYLRNLDFFEEKINKYSVCIKWQSYLEHPY